MAEIYKLKIGSNSSVRWRHAGSLSDESYNLAKAMSQSSNAVTVTSNHENSWVGAIGGTFPAPPLDFVNAYENEPDFNGFLNSEIFQPSLGRNIQKGDVILFEN